MGKPTPRASAKTLALYAKLVATLPSVELKGAAMPYTAVNGNMFSMLAKSGQVALRLPAPEREGFLARYRTKLHEEYGVVREEYVLVPAALLARTKELAVHFQASFDYVSGLKPKPTTRTQAGGRSAPRDRKS